MANEETQKYNCKTCVIVEEEQCLGCPGSHYPNNIEEC